MSSEHKTPIGHAVDLVVFAPLGLALFAKDTVPTFVKLFVDRGHSELTARRKRLGEQTTQYRTVGQFAVRYGGPEVRRQAGGHLDTLRRLAQDPLGGISAPDARAPDTRAPVAPVVPEPAPSPRRSDVVAGNGDAAPAPAAASLAIPDYDQLSASQVVERLAGLGSADLEAVRAYERAHRGRNTILGKIAQLTA